MKIAHPAVLPSFFQFFSSVARRCLRHERHESSVSRWVLELHCRILLLFLHWVFHTIARRLTRN